MQRSTHSEIIIIVIIIIIIITMIIIMVMVMAVVVVVVILMMIFYYFRRCIEFEPSYVKCEELYPSGRMSFKNFNPTVEVSLHV